jgi:hypothetical protein
MMAMAAVMSGAIWLRLTTMAAVQMMWPFGPTYAVAAWLCWLAPLLIAIRLTRGLAAGPGSVDPDLAHLANAGTKPG